MYFPSIAGAGMYGLHNIPCKHHPSIYPLAPHPAPTQDPSYGRRSRQTSRSVAWSQSFFPHLPSPIRQQRRELVKISLAIDPLRLLSYRPTTSISETSSPLIRIARRNEAESVRLRVQQQRESVVCVPPVLGELANREPTKTHPLPATNPILPPAATSARCTAFLWSPRCWASLKLSLSLSIRLINRLEASSISFSPPAQCPPITCSTCGLTPNEFVVVSLPRSPPVSTAIRAWGSAVLRQSRTTNGQRHQNPLALPVLELPITRPWLQPMVR